MSSSGLPSANRLDVETPSGANLPPRVSYSQMSLYEQCALKYFYRYVDGWSEPPTVSLVTGRITHEILEALYRLDPQERTLNTALQLLSEMGPQLLKLPENVPFADDTDMKFKVRQAIENLFRVEQPHEILVQPEHLEMDLEVEINGVKFFGKVDRYTEDGITRVSDYKTGSAPGRYIDDKMRQPMLYALGFKLQHDIDIQELELIFLHANEVHRRDVSQAKMNEMGEALQAMREGSVSDLAASAWSTKTGPLCNYCAFSKACPAKTPGSPMPGSDAADVILIENKLTRRK